jgi:hypothetical protein
MAPPSCSLLLSFSPIFYPCCQASVSDLPLQLPPLLSRSRSILPPVFNLPIASSLLLHGLPPPHTRTVVAELPPPTCCCRAASSKLSPPSCLLLTPERSPPPSLFTRSRWPPPSPCLPFLCNWLIAEDYETLQCINAVRPGHAILMPPAPSAHAAHKFRSQVSTARADPPKCLMKCRCALL